MPASPEGEPESTGPGKPEGGPAPSALAVGARVELRKVHPCGGRVWTVTRVGADIGLCCETCGRRVMLAREEFGRRLQRLLPS